jgi:transcriptional regulator CtsR
MDLCKAIEEYLKTLSPKQYKAYEIARDHLKDSFQIEKSNGFLSWVKKNQIAI